MPIALPDLDRVPEGDHRELLIRLHRLYGLAGRPATRIVSQAIRGNRELEPVSHETVSALFRGDPLPAWNKIRSIIIVLCESADQPVDVKEELGKGVELWSQIPRPPAGGEVTRRLAPRRRPVTYRAPAPPAAAAPAAVRGEIPERDPHFTGRDLLLDAIEQRLAEDSRAPLVLYGPIGVGKTQMAREYVNLHAAEYAVVWWVDARDAERATASLLTLAGRLGVGRSPDVNETLEALFATLGDPGPYLLVFDGVQSDDVRPLIRTIGGSVMVTTRNAGLARENTYFGIKVPDFDISEVAQYLRKQDPHMSKSQTAEAVAAVGCMPLALEAICRLYHDGTVSSWDDLPAHFAASENVMPGGSSRLDLYPERAVRELRAALDDIAGDREALQLLTLLIGFGAGPVWVPLLLAGADGNISAPVRTLLRDQYKLRRKIPILVQHGFARRLPEDGVEIPALIRLVLRELLPDAAGERNRNDVRGILVKADPGHPEDRDTWPTHRAIAPHVLPAGLVDWPQATAYRTVRHQIRFLFLNNKIAAARLLGEKAVDSFPGEAMFGLNGDVYLQIRRDLANALRAAGKYRESEALTAQMSDQVNADPAYADHTIALDLARSRGHDLRLAGHYQEAFDLDDATYQRHLRSPRVDEFRIAASRYNRGVSLRFLGRFREAADDDEAALRLHSRHDPGDRRAHRLLNALAESLYGLGHYEDVVKCLAPVLRHGRERDLLRARRMTGVAHRRLGDAGTAAEELGACQQACIVQVGVTRELTLTVAMSFSNALRDLGQLPAALHFGERAKVLYEKALQADNPLIHAARVNIVATYLAMRRWEDARAMGQDAYEALRGRLGPDHPFTVAAVTNLASAVALCTPAGARQLSEEAYLRALNLYGQLHLDTLLAAANFAADRAARHEGDGSAPSLDGVLRELRRSLGRHHPVVLQVAQGTRALVCVEAPSA
ncbi:FxSxx-COOH system tetratricopeptide repeat protein [Actinoplanes sp. NPDC026623]|uniref:FxSxx-COOH system tetratricopeptide repeat protein n=1 Tax=Actinoplanes sp. NPDC026623 TaxID=3155610 RepID=UPI0033F90893